MAWALCLAFLFTSYSNSQDISTTGNLVNYGSSPTDTTSVWHNGVYVNQLSCWAWGDPGNCGPNPSVRPNGQINFSFGMTDLYQIASVKNSLPNSGSGLQVNGFNFGFMAKNGNGWDNGQTDYLTAYVKFYDPTNTKVIENYDWNLNYKFNWTYFNYDKTFATPYAVPNMGNVQYGFVGMDTNYWAGTYGPEVYNVSFNLKYSVDPCATNPLYSPTCKGYMDALAKLAPVAVADSLPPPPEDGAPPPPPPPPGSPPPPGPPVAGPPPPAGSQPKPSENKSSSDNKAGPSLGTVLSMIGSNQARINNEAKSVVQAAESAAAKDAQQAQEQAETIAASAVSQSTTTTTTASSTSSTSSQAQSSAGPMSGATQTNVGKVEVLKSNGPAQTTESTSTSVATFTIEVLKPATQPAPASDTTSTTTVALVNNSYVQPSIENITGLQTMNTNSESTRYELFTLRPTINNTVEIETPQLEGIKIGTRSVLNDAIEERPMLQSTNTQEQKTETVNKNVQPNELAGAVDITKMATQPAGYQAYSVMMPDVAFYAPKEIYKNQVNVDNVRLLRGLGSDRLHQEMVNQQYRLGN